MDNLDFLDGGEPPIADAQPQEPQVEEPVAAAEPVEEQPQEAPTETPEQAAARVRDEKGRFTKKEPTEPPVMVPLQALHETRDEVKALKQQLEAMKQPQQAADTETVPDIFENPEGYQAHIQSQMTAALLDTRLNLSEEMVRQSAGDEVVNAAQEWAKQVLPVNAAFAQAFYSQRNPYGFLVEQYKQQSLVSQLTNDPKQIEAFLAWQQQGQAQPAQATEQQPSPTPPRSIASATSAGGVSHIASGPGVAFGEFIK